MTEVERQTLEDARTACLASAEAIAAVLAGAQRAKISIRDAFVPLKTAAAAWGITEDAARKKVKRLTRLRPEWATKRGSGQWWVNREALR